jgi:hypothetical protein
MQFRRKKISQNKKLKNSTQINFTTNSVVETKFQFVVQRLSLLNLSNNSQ